MATSNNTPTSNVSDFGLEPLVVEYVCRPILKLIPDRVSPNTISVLNNLFAWAAFALAVLAPQLSQGQALAARVIAGACVWAYIIGDLLDGMQARKTGQTSRLGEYLDHGLDAMNVPLVAGGLVITMELGPVVTAIAVVTASWVYLSQLLYHHVGGKFLEPPLGGSAGGLLAGVSIALLGGVLYLWPRDTAAVGWGFVIFAWLGVAGSLNNCLFYARLMGRKTLESLPFAVLTLGVAGLFWAGIFNDVTLAILLIVVSYRIGSNFVLATIEGRPVRGFDPWVVAWLVGLALAGWLVPDDNRILAELYLPVAACLHFVVLNVTDAYRQLGAGASDL